MQLPPELLGSLEGLPGFNRASFESVHASGEQVTSIRLNPFKVTSPENIGFTSTQKIAWAETGYYLPSRPSFTFDPHFHAGCYYVQEASSMFLEQVFLQTRSTANIRVLDLCAAPGGKSTHLLSLMSPDSLLVSNELIRSRVNILMDNIIKWGRSNVVITNNDARDFSRLPGYFDMIVVDAPCSGSGLFRREPTAINEWSEGNVALCCERQQRILADVLPSLKENGILVYSTCSYSKEEDEDIATWLVDEMHMHSLKLDIRDGWGVIPTGNALRFYPDKLKGEGFYIAAFQKKHGDAKPKYRVSKPEPVKTTERELLTHWTDPGQFFFRHGQTICAIPASLQVELGNIYGGLKVTQAGLQIGEVIRDKVIPHHMLAMSDALSPEARSVTVNLEEAVKYLQKKEVGFNDPGKGWNVVRYNGHNLGWINVLQGRVNNYYPKEMRILKQ